MKLEAPRRELQASPHRFRTKETSGPKSARYNNQPRNTDVQTSPTVLAGGSDQRRLAEEPQPVDGHWPTQ